MSDYLTNLENKLDAEEHKTEMMNDQIQIMYAYIEKLERVHLELKCMLNVYHDDDCIACDRAYESDDYAEYQKRSFYCHLQLAGDDWIHQEVNK